MDNAIFEYLHGRPYTLDGISGQFEYRSHQAIYPYPRMVARLWHTPDAAGRDTEEYRKLRRQLGDDWSTDLTDSIERFCAIALELGYNG
jgi:hypothetical protein